MLFPARASKFKKGVSHPFSRHKQQGYIALLTLLVLILGAGTIFGIVSEDSIIERKSHLLEKEMVEIEEIKRRLIQYAVLFPEIMTTDETTPSILTAMNRLPSPGYLPCPDMDRDSEGKSDSDCGNPLVAGNATTGFSIGFLPTAITLRHQYFSGYQPQQPQQFFYAIDEHLAYKNTNYNNVGGGGPARYAPLHLLHDPAAVANLIFDDGERPVLTLNGDGQRYVAIIIAPGDPLSGQNRGVSGSANSVAVISAYLEGENADLDGDFYSSGKATSNTGNDIVIGITAEEWMNHVSQRVCMEYKRYVNANDDGLDAAGTSIEDFWFNAYDATDNPTGTGFRELIDTGVIGCGG